jgi:sugar/nucleoside kinase (ribokinase family)
MAEDHAGAPVDPARVGILAVGNLIIDKTHRVPAYPAESFLAVIAASSASPGGGAINVLFDLAQVDPALPLALAGLVGDDEDGRFLRAAAEARHIHTGRVGVVAERPTSFTQVMISESNATRTFFHAHGANSRLDLGYIQALEGRERIAHVAYLLLLEGLDVPDRAFGSGGAHALALLRSKGFRTSLDLVSDSDPARYRDLVVPALAHTDYLIVNDVEAAGLTGTASASGADAVDWAAAFAQAERLLELGVRELVVIHFPAGAVAITRAGERHRQPAFHVPKARVVSSLGAGDAFCAGTLYGIHQGFGLARCLELGAALAHFNLFAASATDGAVPIAQLDALIAAGPVAG